MEPQHSRFNGQNSLMGRWRRGYIFILGAVLVVCLYAFFQDSMSGKLHGHSQKPPSEAHYRDRNGAPQGPLLPMDELIRQLWASEKLNITAPLFVDQDGDNFKLPQIPSFSEKLGKRICILDVDTRPFEKEGELLNPRPWDWNKVEHLSSGIMGHYLYSVIHGYDYMMLRSPKYQDRHDAWGKVLMMEHALQNHDYVIFFDSDAIMANPEIPMEWLFNYWQITPSNTITIASESLLDRDKDEKGNPGQNTGFMIVQNTPKTHEIYRAWAECPEETRYKGCTKWKQTRLREQSAFTNYIVYDYREDIKILPCTEANGYPE